MNAERLHAIVKAIRQDLGETDAAKLLTLLSKNLEALASQPSASAAQEQVSSILKTLAEKLKSASSNDFPPTWRQAIDEFGLTDLLGRRLNQRISRVFTRNQLTPAVALKEIQDLRDRVQSLGSAADQLLGSFEYLEIGAEELEPGQAEVGILVPRDFIKNRLDELGDELTELDQILGVFSEIATGSRPSFGIRTISTTDVSLFLDAAPPVAALVAVAVERVLKGYKTLLEIRKLRSDLLAQKMPEDNLRGIDDWAEQVMAQTVKDAVPGLMDEFYKGDDKGRRNELASELRRSLRLIAARVDRGFNIEVRIVPKADSPDPESDEAKAQKRYTELIGNATETLQFLKADGPPILALPASTEKEAGPDQAPPKEVRPKPKRD